MTFRREVIRLGHARQAGMTPFFGRAVEKFRREVEAPMDAAWRALPPTERGIFESWEIAWNKEDGRG